MPATKTTTAPPAVRQPKDPEAAALAAAARDLARAAGLKSAYTPAEARGVLDHVTVEKAPRGVLVLARDGVEPQRMRVSVLRAFISGEKTDDTRAAAKVMAELARDLPGTVYGRKMAAFLLAAATN